MNKIQSFTDLRDWREEYELVLEIYKRAQKFLKEETFGLTNQIRRACVSITSNIAKGFSRNSYKEKSQFYSIALGSLTEIQIQLLIAKDIDYTKQQEFKAIAEKTITISKMLNGLIKTSKTKIRYS